MEKGALEDQPKITRRKFLKELVGTALIAPPVVGGVVSAYKSAEVLAPILHRLTQDGNDEFSPMNAEELKQSIEEKFQVELLPKGTPLPHHPNDNTALPQDRTLPWDETDLRRLGRALSELPPHFYLPRQAEDREMKIRVGLSGVVGRCFCAEDPEAYKNNQGLLIILHQELHRTASFLNDRQLKGREPAVFQVAHEFAHQITSPQIGKYIESIIEPLEIGEEGLVGVFSSEFEWPSKYSLRVPSELSHHVSEIHMGLSPDILDYQKHPEEYIVLNDSFIINKATYVSLGRKYFEKDTLELYQRYGGEGKMWLYKATIRLEQKSRLGYGATKATEFLSVATENYIRGYDYFIRLYEPFLGQERAEKLYGSVKDEIFRGKEY